MVYSALFLQFRSTVLVQRHRRRAGEDEVVLESWLSFFREQETPSCERVQAVIKTYCFICVACAAGSVLVRARGASLYCDVAAIVAYTLLGSASVR